MTSAITAVATVTVATAATRFRLVDFNPALSDRCLRLRRFCSSRASILAQGSASEKWRSTFKQSLHGSVREHCAEFDCCRIR